ncbi:hypothetical protein [Erythrobacter sp.]|uniref:hypothetical protein n=1 Tax=Erythrobacter sp. TaxID=1042 RepID=UPI001425C33C|nr:hypothetical protein [Erythrobacter sp.]QIQ86203.1 MAG: hypothetical protein G9473_05500 [Erythrobacter sp.]
MTKPFACALIAPLAFALAACGSQTPAESGNDADTFAERIKGATPAPAPNATEPPRVAAPLPGAAPGPYAPGTATDPEAKTCNAPAMGPYIGKVADDATRAEIMQVIGGANEVRFIQAGSPYIKPDPTNPRLNLMLDAQNIIRDARCG